MDVVVVPDHRMPVVTHMVWFRAGSADEMQGKSGIAHFLEHLMFKGTKKIAPGEYSKIVARNGGIDNAFTSWDYTAIYERVAKDRLELVMGMNADRLADLQLTDKVVLPELQVILEERRQRIEDNPDSLLEEQMDATLYENSRYGIPVIGWFHEMQGLTTTDALDWWTHHYCPNNAVLVVAGDITAAGTQADRRPHLRQSRRTQRSLAQPRTEPAQDVGAACYRHRRACRAAGVGAHLPRAQRKRCPALGPRSTSSPKFSADQPPAASTRIS